MLGLSKFIEDKNTGTVISISPSVSISPSTLTPTSLSLYPLSLSLSSLFLHMPSRLCTCEEMRAVGISLRVLSAFGQGTDDPGHRSVPTALSSLVHWLTKSGSLQDVFFQISTYVDR